MLFSIDHSSSVFLIFLFQAYACLLYTSTLQSLQIGGSIANVVHVGQIGFRGGDEVDPRLGLLLVLSGFQNAHGVHEPDVYKRQVYNYLPFMILPIYSVIVKLDHSLIEAARDLGANSVQVFRRVILPLSLPGVLSGITMVFVPSVSTFAISKMLGGGTEMLLGDLIEQQYMGGAYNPYLGAAISLVMMVIVVICMVVMNRFGEGEEQAVMM